MTEEQEEQTVSLQELLDQHDYSLPKVGEIRKGIIVAINDQDIIVDLGTKRDGLVPPMDLSKLDPEERASLKVDDEIDVYILNTSEDSLKVSINLARLNQDWIKAEKLMASGEVIEGEIIGYNKGGAIVPFGRLRGFVPASHLKDLTPGMGDRKRQQRLAKLRGEKLPLKIIEVDRRRRRLVFSQREAQKEWEEARKQELLDSLEEGSTLTGRISGLRDFGVFVDLGGADGLVHISELAWHRVDHPREVVQVGDEIEVYVLRLDRDSQRISLSRKQLLPNPWETVEERYALHQLVEGTITRIVEYGAFAEIEPGIEGLLHISQLSRSSIQDPHEVVNENEVHLLRVVSIDPKRQRMGLSLRAVTANEQIEWMAQREVESQEEVTETVEEMTTDTIPATEDAVDEEAVAVAEAAVAEAAVAEAAVAEAAAAEAAVVETAVSDGATSSEEE